MSGRGSLFVASLLWGMSIGLVAYRFAVMPFIWHSPMRIVVPGLATGLFVAGVQIARMRPKQTGRRSEPYPLMAMLGLFAVGFVPVFAVMRLVFPPLSVSPLTKRDLPGFSLALPAGEAVNETVGYPAGTIMLKRVGDGSGVVIVSWEPGGNPTRDELGAMMPVFAKLVTNDEGTTKLGSVPGPDGKPVDTIAFDTDTLDMELTMLVCGVRHVLVATAATSGVMPLHERIIASFQCHPDPAQEATATSLAFPLALDLPGWHLVARDEEVTQISTDNASLVLRAQPPSLKTPDLASFIAPAFEQTGVHVSIVERRGNDFIKVKLDDQGNSGMGWVALFRCPTAIALVLGLANDDATVTALYETVRGARCLRAGEKPTEFSEAP